MTSRVLVINCVVAVLFSSAHSLDTPDGIPVIIGRRQSGDIYYLNQSSQGLGICSEGENTTYLVVDRCCVSTLNLLNECSFALTLTSAPSNLTLSIPLSSIMPGYTVNPGAKAIVNERQGSLNRPINSSRCRIASLEVYRGREQAISINYSGFSLGNGSSLEINTTDLVFDPLDLVGELYRMNISCLDRVESGCMFFKIFGITNISEAKFDCSVSGTLSYVGCITFVTTNRDMATLSPTSNSPTSVNIVHDLATLSTNSSTLPPTGFFDGILVAVISLVGGMTILIISTVIVVVCVVWFRNTRMGQKSTSHVHVAAQLQNQESDTIPSNCQSNPAYIHFGPTKSSPAGSLSDNHSENLAYNINTQPTSHQEPTYEVIPSDTDRSTPHTVQGAQNVHCDQNPAYIHVLGIHTEERLPTDQLPQCDYSQNPAYGIHSSPNN